MGADFLRDNDGVLYFANQYTYLNDLDSLYQGAWRTKRPCGIVMYTGLNFSLTSNVFGSRNLLELDQFFAENRTLIPVIVLVIDKIHFDDIYKGDFDKQLAELAEFLITLERPVMLSIGLEVNNPIYANDPEVFKRAYRYVVDEIERFRVKNVAYVWSVEGMKSDSSHTSVSDWFPGSQYVNWIATSVFKIVPEHYSNDILFTGPNYREIMSLASEEDLPVIILESSAKAIQKSLNLSGQLLWGEWYEPFFRFVEENPRIRAVSHINHHWSDSIVKENFMEKLDKHPFVLSSIEGDQQQFWSIK